MAQMTPEAAQVRRDIVEMIYTAQSGHPGGSLSIVEMLLALYNNVMRYRADDPKWEDRDRLVLSKGHACPALYAVLAAKGFFPREELITLRKFGSHLQGHPDMWKCPGVDASTGSLGQGMSMSVGYALAGKRKAEPFNVYVITGDGESQEGIIWESAMAAAHYKLDNLTVMLDHNGLQIDGTNDQVMSVGDICKKYEAFGWEVLKADGHDIDALTAALKKPRDGRPRFICCETVKGKGVSYMENNVNWHGKAPNAEQYAQAMKDLEVC